MMADRSRWKKSSRRVNTPCHLRNHNSRRPRTRSAAQLSGTDIGTRRKGMISHHDLSQLHHYPSGPDSLILSLYVNIDQSNAANLNRGFETSVETLFRQVAGNPSHHENKQRFDG